MSIEGFVLERYRENATPREFREDVLKFLQSYEKPIPTGVLAFLFCANPRKLDKVLESFVRFGQVRRVTTVKMSSWQAVVKEGKE